MAFAFISKLHLLCNFSTSCHRRWSSKIFLWRKRFIFQFHASDQIHATKKKTPTKCNNATQICIPQQRIHSSCAAGELVDIKVLFHAKRKKKKMSPPSLIFGGINNAGRRKANSAAFSSKLTALAICVLLDSAAPFGPPICKCGKAAESCDLRNKHGGGMEIYQSVPRHVIR